MSLNIVETEQKLSISRLVEKQNLSNIASLNQKAAALSAAGKKVFKLSGGDPSHLPAKLKSILHEMSVQPEQALFNYSPIAGFDRLRELLAGISAPLNKHLVKSDNILVCSGGCSGLFLTFKSILNPGDKVLIPDPCWEYLPRLVENCGGIPVPMRFFAAPYEATNWDEFESEIITQLQAGIKVVALNSPLNPSGKIIPATVKNNLIRVCKEYDAWVLSDDVTADFNYIEDRRATPIDNLSNYISVNSFSKNIGITGLRFGYVCASEFLINQLKKSQLYTFMYPNSLVQKLVENYLSDGFKDYYSFIEHIHSEYKQKSKNYTQMLAAIPQLEVHEPDGGLFLFPRMKGNRILDYDKLLTQYNVAVAPGAAFGSKCENHFRIFMGCETADMQTVADTLKLLLSEV